MNALSTVHPFAAAEPLAAAQHRAALWADPALSVYAVVMGRRVADLPARLALADVADFDCLRPGVLAPDAQRDAPYLARLTSSSAFGDWLLSDAPAAFPDWGVLLRSPARLLPLRNHLRGLLRVRLPGGQPIDLDWMDPPLLRALLPGFDAAGLTAFFGPVRGFTVPGATAWWHADAVAGQARLHEVPVRAGPRVD